MLIRQGKSVCETAGGSLYGINLIIDVKCLFDY